MSTTKPELTVERQSLPKPVMTTSEYVRWSDERINELESALSASRAELDRVIQERDASLQEAANIATRLQSKLDHAYETIDTKAGELAASRARVGELEAEVLSMRERHATQRRRADVNATEAIYLEFAAEQLWDALGEKHEQLSAATAENEKLRGLLEDALPLVQGEADMQEQLLDPDRRTAAAIVARIRSVLSAPAAPREKGGGG